jgi:ubiquinone/menaquinone biosynthesis C-methylase UbiE
MNVTTEYYNHLAFSYDELYGEEQKRKLALIEPFLDSKSILDVGCGTGIASPEGAVGVDSSKELLEKNQNTTMLGIAEALPFADKSFDIITCMTAIHHFDLDKSLEEMQRVAINKVIITVLKKAQKFEQIVLKVKEKFNLIEEVDEEKDLILILSVN